jgi:hypothetical protein
VDYSDSITIDSTGKTINKYLSANMQSWKIFHPELSRYLQRFTATSCSQEDPCIYCDQGDTKEDWKVSDMLIVIGVILFWIILQKFILPRFGIKT